VATFTFLRNQAADQHGGMIEVDLPFTEATVQEIGNAARAYEALNTSADNRPLISAGGKESLGLGNVAGITMTLLNGWRLQFAARAGPALTTCNVIGGNVVRADPIEGATTSSGGTTTINDTNATFLSDGIRPGDRAQNVTDSTETTVVSVDSDTQITTNTLASVWSGGDEYRVTATQVTAPTANVHITIAQSTAPIDVPGLATEILEQMIVQTLGSIDPKPTMESALLDIVAMAKGRIVEALSNTFDFHEPDGTTVRYRLVKTDTERVPS
jgi:hypothetical protein